MSRALRIKAAEAAINRVFADPDVPTEETVGDLRALQEHIDALIASLAPGSRIEFATTPQTHEAIEPRRSHT